jgi:hypothetical protein
MYIKLKIYIYDSASGTRDLQCRSDRRMMMMCMSLLLLPSPPPFPGFTSCCSSFGDSVNGGRRGFLVSKTGIASLVFC